MHNVSWLESFAGVQILDLSRLIAGPYCAQLFADLGADVIKVEPPEGDDSRHLGPPFVDGQGVFFLSANGGKRSAAIDLRTPAGLAALHLLARRSDVLIENFRPGVTKRLGVDYPTIAALNPRIVYCSITGFGESGPLAARGGVDTVFQAMGGLVGLVGSDESAPVKLGSPIADVAAAQSAAFAVSAALFRRQRSGQGAHVAVAVRDALVSLLAPVMTYALVTGEEPPCFGNASQFAAPADIFVTSDGHIAISTVNNRHWTELCAAIGTPQLARDQRFSEAALRLTHRVALTAELNAIFGQHTTMEWEQMLARSGVPFGPVMRICDVLADPQLKINGTVIEQGERSAIGLPFRIDGNAKDRRERPPALGEHTREVLAAAEIAEDQASSQSHQKKVS